MNTEQIAMYAAIAIAIYIILIRPTQLETPISAKAGIC